MRIRLRAITLAVATAVALTGCSGAPSQEPVSGGPVVARDALNAVGCTPTAGSAHGQIVIANTFHNRSHSAKVVLKSVSFSDKKDILLASSGIYLGAEKTMDMLPLPLSDPSLAKEWVAQKSIVGRTLQPNETMQVGIAVALKKGAKQGTTGVFRLNYTVNNRAAVASGLERYQVALVKCQ